MTVRGSSPICRKGEIRPRRYAGNFTTLDWSAKNTTRFGWRLFNILNSNYAIFATRFVKREILRAARFFGITLPADFIIRLSALRKAVVAAALSPDSTATKTFFAAVLTVLRRELFTAFFLAVTRILFLDDL